MLFETPGWIFSSLWIVWAQSRVCNSLPSSLNTRTLGLQAHITINNYKDSISYSRRVDLPCNNTIGHVLTMALQSCRSPSDKSPRSYLCLPCNQLIHDCHANPLDAAHVSEEIRHACARCHTIHNYFWLRRCIDA